MIRDIGLPSSQDEKRQGHVERVSCTQQKVKHPLIPVPVPNEITDQEKHRNTHRIEWKEIRGKRDEEIGFCDDHVATLRCDFKLFNSSSKRPRPKRVCQFMTKNVNPHWLRQEQEHDDPTSHPCD